MHSPGVRSNIYNRGTPSPPRFLMGWRGHLKIDRFIATVCNTPALAPREALVHNQVFQVHNRRSARHYFCSGVLKSTVLFLAGPFHILGRVGLAPSKREVLCRYCGARPQKLHSGVVQGIAARVCFFCLGPDPFLTFAYARQMALRVVGPVGTRKSGRFYAGALCLCPP